MPAVKPRKRLTREEIIRNRMKQWREQNPKATHGEYFLAFDDIVDELDQVDANFIEKELTKRK
jgi:hypothetical protein